MKELLNFTSWIIYLFFTFFLVPLLAVLYALLAVLITLRFAQAGWVRLQQMAHPKQYRKLAFPWKTVHLKVFRLSRVAQ